MNDEAATYEFRWDVEVPDTEKRYGQKFMKQWKRLLQLQKMTPLSSKVAPQNARFQLCVNGGTQAGQIELRTAEIVEELSHLHRGKNLPAIQEAGQHPAGWQGVRVWMTFARQDVEAVLGKKVKL